MNVNTATQFLIVHFPAAEVIPAVGVKVIGVDKTDGSGGVGCTVRRIWSETDARACGHAKEFIVALDGEGELRSDG